eukprot:2126853-Rhodomonas_salina.3
MPLWLPEQSEISSVGPCSLACANGSSQQVAAPAASLSVASTTSLRPISEKRGGIHSPLEILPPINAPPGIFMLWTRGPWSTVPLYQIRLAR